MVNFSLQTAIAVKNGITRSAWAFKLKLCLQKLNYMSLSLRQNLLSFLLPHHQVVVYMAGTRNFCCVKKPLSIPCIFRPIKKGYGDKNFYLVDSQICKLAKCFMKFALHENWCCYFNFFRLTIEFCFLLDKILK